MNIWFWSDTHFGHWNICKYCNRPFKTLEEMNSTMIIKFNERVKENEQVYFLGDFCFRSGSKRGEGEPKKPEYYLNQLNTKNIIFIQGNHDKNNSLKTPIQNLALKYGGKRINLVHNPDFCNINHEINIVGHVHNNWEIKRIRKGMDFTDCINVSVDVWDFYPMSWAEIWQRYSQWLKEEKNK